MSMRLTLPMSDAELIRVSNANPGFQFERDADGALVVSPTSTNGGGKSAEALGQLYLYSKRVGGKVFDADTGFAIGPGSAVRSPDASWVSAERIAALTSEQREVFWPISPDVAVEVGSPSDRFADVVAKVHAYIERGSSYAVAIDPQTRTVVEAGSPPPDLRFDFDAIIDA